MDTTWLLISASTGNASASLRVTVWRRLRGLGALYLQQSVCLLPDLPPVAASVAELRERVLREGGAMRVLPIAVPDADVVAELVAELNTARDAEYDDLLERLPALHEELDIERRRGRATYEEVEENEIDLDRFRTWAAKIAARDYFGAPGGARVQAALEDAAAALRAFESDALRAAAQERPDAGARPLRFVGETP